MERTEVKVRRAVKEDAPLLAWAVLESTRGHQARGFMDVRFSFLLPEREDEVLRVLRQMVEDDAPTCVRWDGFLVAELDSQAAAVLCCCGPREKPFDEYYALVERVVASQGWPAEWVDSLHQKYGRLTQV
ncbi:uncharacterized protein ACA1_068560 [Acanthamoeba castellanii str. Neff]|uniref:N-acetyltransferase domain-containing protein n=1 Tax=Acanthamoeba castellanii (strain ATCC 30010 / Neff) TaxID=1257118 RepID=L8HDG3_ACACF|nr:uncharacterized protein ACA1_068560 [Acanthamoeba castellanii str. Neff]ELR23272.1 hypothetical protein ACA1_068560 [Acanthamoeba castellanii str. Neff]